MMISASQAAKLSGKSVPTITRAIKSGKLSAERNGDGWLIDTSELHRVFEIKPKGNIETHNETRNKLRAETPSENSALETEVKMLREMLELHQKQIEQLQQDKASLHDDKTRLWQTLESLTKQLPAPDTSDTKKRPWWSFKG